MSSKDKYVDLAVRHIDKLQGEINSSTNLSQNHCRVCLEALPFYHETDTNLHRQLHYRFAHLDVGRFTNIHSIPLPNGNHFFFCVCTKQTLINLLKTDEGAESFRAESWEALFLSDYEYWNYIFIAKGKRRSLNNSFIDFRGAFSELVPGDIIDGHNITGDFSGYNNSVSEMPLADEKRREYIPLPPAKDVTPVEIDPTQYHFFLIDNFGVSLDGESYIALPFGLQWWPSSCFPFEDIVLDNLVPLHSISEHQTFTGVLLVPIDQKAITPDDKQVAYLKVQSQVKRVRTYIAANGFSKLSLLGDVQIGSTGHGYYKQRSNIESPYLYRCWSEKYIVKQARFSPSLLISAIEFAFTDPPKKGVLKYLHRAIDSFDLARSLTTDPLLAHIIVWAAIETLLSPSDKTELISNITLCLIGLKSEEPGKMDFWDLAKKSYQMRSNIVHSFDIPDQKSLEKSLSFAEGQCLKVLQFAITTPLQEGWSRDDLIAFLRTKAFA